MRFSSIIPVALAVAPAAVSATGFIGFALGDKKTDGSCKFQADYEADFDALSSLTKLVRIYAASDCNTAQQILPAAASKGFQVILGIWLVTMHSFFWA
jgi:glucan 1,3-beta-glucosidase